MDNEPKPSTSGLVSSAVLQSNSPNRRSQSSGWISVPRKAAPPTSTDKDSPMSTVGLESSTDTVEDLQEVQREKSSNNQELSSHSPNAVYAFRSKNMHGKKVNKDLKELSENCNNSVQKLVKEDSQHKPKYTVPIIMDANDTTHGHNDIFDEVDEGPVVGKVKSVKKRIKVESPEYDIAPRNSEIKHRLKVESPEHDISPRHGELPEQRAPQLDSTLSSDFLSAQLLLVPTTVPVKRQPNKKKGVCFDDSDSEDQQTTAPAKRGPTQPSKKKGVCFDESDSDGENNSSENSQDKYERIMLENKRKLNNSGWVDARKMKKKLNKNSLFKR